MQRQYVVAFDRSGNVGVSASVRVTDLSGNLAPLFSDDGETPQANPFLTDQNGGGFFYAANGRYRIAISGGGLTDIVQEDIMLFDSADAALESNQVAGLGDLSGQAQYELLISDGTNFQSTPLEGSVIDARYAKVNAGTDGWILVTANRAGLTAPLESDNLGAGYLAVWRQAGTDKAWITNDGGAEFSGAVVVQGDLTVNGVTTYIDSTVVDIGDNIITLNAGEVGAPTQDAGIEIERGTSANVSLLWDESATRWAWTADGLTFYTVPGLGRDEVVSGNWNFTGALTAGGNAVWNQGNIGTQINALTADVAPDGAADYIVTYDATDGSAKKVLLDNLPGGGGASDHGALTGLADDDHPQYFNAARGDARYLRCDTSDTMNGNLTVTGDITGLTSDRRLKRYLGGIDSAAIIDSIEPIRHSWDASKCAAAGFEHYDAAEHYGFDALQIYDVLGETVAPLAPFDRDEKDPTKSRSGQSFRTFKEKELLAILWAEVRTLRNRVAELECEK